jgi:hypothetical protein
MWKHQHRDLLYPGPTCECTSFWHTVLGCSDTTTTNNTNNTGGGECIKKTSNIKLQAAVPRPELPNFLSQLSITCTSTVEEVNLFPLFPLDANTGPQLFDIIRCSCLLSLDQGDIKDTTGAGDSFIGGFLTGLTSHFHPQHCLQLGTAVASEKLKQIGARAALPTTAQLVEVLQKAGAANLREALCLCRVHPV